MAINANSISFSIADDKSILQLIQAFKQGIKYSEFASLANSSPFSMDEWSGFLHLSERTMHRYKMEKKTFPPASSEKILEIAMLYNLGIEVFGDKEKFNSWLDAKSIALGGARPKELLDNSFGIHLLKDELGRIEHGILA